jgi:hypothetical protein
MSALPRYELKELAAALGRMAAQHLREDPEVLAEVTETKADLKRYLMSWLRENDDVAEELLKWLQSHVSREEFLEAANLEKLMEEGEAIAKELEEER